MCIRAREVKMKEFNSNDIRMDIYKYESSSGIEYFISYESRDSMTLYGFVRLRLNREWNDVMDHLRGHALIQELHVYGLHTNVGNKNQINTQHNGLGRKLLKKAEQIAFENGYNKISVISGVGVRNYYKRHGYSLDQNTMKKTLHVSDFPIIIFKQIMFFSLLFVIAIIMNIAIRVG